MSFRCIGCESIISKSHIKKDAKTGDFITISCCQKCGLVQLGDIPSEQDLYEFYTSKYRVEYRKQDRPSSKHVYRAGALAISRLKKLSPFLKKKAKLLDIGSGGGEFTYLASRMGADARGIDPSSGYLEFGKNHYSIDVEQKQISELGDTQSYQVITMFHVLEHLPDPLRVIRKVHQILKVGGCFIIEVPSLESKASSPFNHFFKAHICYFTSLSLIGLLKDNFTIEYLENKNAIFVVCRKSDGKRFEKPSNQNLLAVKLANSRLKHKNLREYIFNGGLLKVFKKIPLVLHERYFSRGKEPKKILDLFLTREKLAIDDLH